MVCLLSVFVVVTALTTLVLNERLGSTTQTQLMVERNTPTEVANACMLLNEVRGLVQHVSKARKGPALPFFQREQRGENPPKKKFRRLGCVHGVYRTKLSSPLPVHPRFLPEKRRWWRRE
jgi:hypothetical protein